MPDIREQEAIARKLLPIIYVLDTSGSMSGDCIAAVNSSFPIMMFFNSIYIGISMGATTVLMASGLDLPKSVHGVMADCGFTSPDAEWKHVMENNLHLPYRFHSRLADMMFSQKNSAHLTDYSTVDALRETELPVLFVHGTSDFLVPVEMTYENYQACRSPKRLLIVPGADHGVSYCVERERYEQAVKDFWRDFD